MKKLLAFVLSVSLCAGLLTACGAQSGESAVSSSSAETSSVQTDLEKNGVAPVGSYPIVTEPLTLSIMGRKDPGAPDWGDLELFKRLTEITGISFDFEMSETESFDEQKNIALVGGQYPGMIWRSAGSAVTDEETYGPQGIFLDLTDLIDKYAPNLKALLEKRPDVKAAITALDGKIYGLPYVFETATTEGHSGFFDSKWMENVGITKVPETTDELYEMLKAFKEKDANGNGDPNDEIPISCVGLDNITVRRLLVTAFTGLPDGLGFNISDDGKVVYSPATPEYKGFLEFARKLYSEELLDAEFSTQTAQQQTAKVKGGIVGVYCGSPTGLDPSTTSQQLSLPPLTSATNSKKVLKGPDGVNPGRAFITDKCENPIAAIRLIDMFYATADNAVEGFSGQTPFLGWENETWKYTNSSKTVYEWIAPVTGFADINKTVSVTMHLPGFLSFLAMPSGNPLMEMKVTQVEKMQKPYYTDAYPISARFSQEESDRGNTIENDLKSYVLMMSTKFITGEESLDNFDQYLSTIEKTGLPELLSIKTDAYSRWKAAYDK